MITDHLAAHRHPLVVTGDFNIPSVLANKKLISYMDTFEFRTIIKRISTYRLAMVRYQLDYFFTKRCIINSLTAERIHFSDHYPITAVIRLPH
jgi:endonuclease/exonuclease/phosphatase family metal-dependent hydrolase